MQSQREFQNLITDEPAQAALLIKEAIIKGVGHYDNNFYNQILSGGVLDLWGAMKYLYEFYHKKIDLDNSLTNLDLHIQSSGAIQEELCFIFYSGANVYANFKIYANSGIIVMDDQILLHEGINNICKNISSLATGIYNLVITHSDNILIEKFIKK